MKETTPILFLKKLSIGYANKKALVTPFSVKAHSGELIALMGLNGTGKTTLFKTILEEIPALAGGVEVNGKTLHLKDLKHCISVVFTDRVSIFGFTVRDLIAMGRMPYTNRFGKLTAKDNEIIERSIVQLKLEHIADTQINSLSDGQFQKVMIARALTQETPLLLLDEPTAFLDIKNKAMIYSLLRELTLKYGKTIIVSTHQLEFCTHYCDKAWMIKNSELTEKMARQVKEEDFD